MAFCANRVLIRIRPQELVLEGAMGIMAVAANHQAFIHLVVKRLGERCLYIGVAAVTQLRLLDLQQMLPTLEGMVAMATDATDAGCAMSRPIEVGVRPQMATEALLIDLFGGCLGEAKYLGHVTTRLHVGLGGAVAALAGHAFAVVHQRELRMRIGGKLL